MEDTVKKCKNYSRLFDKFDETKESLVIQHITDKVIILINIEFFSQSISGNFDSSYRDFKKISNFLCTHIHT